MKHGKTLSRGEQIGSLKLDGMRHWNGILQEEHLPIDGSLNEVSGRHAACGWAAVQLDYDDRGTSFGTQCSSSQILEKFKKRTQGLAPNVSSHDTMKFAAENARDSP